MKNQSIKLLLIIVGIIIYDILFWENYLGLNAFLFIVMLLTCMFSVQQKLLLNNKKILITSIGTLLAGILVVTHNSVTSIVSLIGSYIIMAGFYFQPELKSVAAAIPTGLLNFFIAPFSVFNEERQIGGFTIKSDSAWYVVRLSIVPVVVVFVFYMIYKAANPVFDRLSSDLFTTVVNTINDLFEYFTWSRFFFIMLGLFILIGVFVNSNIKKFVNWDNRSQDALETNPFIVPDEKKRLFNVNDEYRIGLILMGLINVLILIVNIIDIVWLWFGFEFKEDMNLSQLVHEGTYLLILSILLSIAIMTFIFRGILNYKDKGSLLRYFAYTWIVQNAIMALSVAIRNYHYINYYGLAYKRIGVIVFLVLTLFGLAALTIKIKEKKSLYFLIRTFSWAVYFMMFFISIFNWDVIIAKHNARHKFPDNMDIYFLLSLSDKSLHVIDKYDALLDRDIKNEYADGSNFISRREYFNKRVKLFIERKQKESWLEWNYPEYVTYNYFKNKNYQNGQE